MITLMTRPIVLIALAVLGLALPQAAKSQIVIFPTGQVLPLVLPPEAALDEGPYGDLLWQVQKCTDCGDGYNDNGPKRKSNNRYGTNLNSGTTNDIVRLLKGANDTCNEHILRRYRVDCLRIYYGWVADSLPDSGDYLPIKKAMRKAEQKLAAIVSANVDRTEPVITPRDGHKKNAKKLPPLRAIKKSAESKAVAQAEKVVKETELVILRSGEDPTRRTAHYEEVSAALDSNLVILRSA